MIQFLVTAVIVVIFVFILVVVLAVMTWVITRLLRFLFPQRFAAAVKTAKAKKKQSKPVKGELMEDRCPECTNFGNCPAAMQMPAPCRMYAAPPEDPVE